MATAFNYYQPQDVAGMKAKKQGLLSDVASLTSQKEQAQAADLAFRNRSRAPSGGLMMGLGATNDPYHNVVGGKKAMDLGNRASALESQANAIDTTGAETANRVYGMTAGVSDQIMNDPQVAAALAQLESGMKEGPYSQAVQQQLVNRQADQSAAAEAVNADEMRNLAAARGLDPTQALRQGQQSRQAQNLAFSGDLRTKATLDNYAAQQAAAQNIAGTRLGQFGQAQPGYMQAADYATRVKDSAGRVSAVNNNSAPRLAFAGNQGSTQGGGTQPKPVIQPTPKPAPYVQPKPMSVAERNAKQAEWEKSVGRTGAYGPTAATPAQDSTIYKTPSQTNALKNSLNSGSFYAQTGPNGQTTIGGLKFVNPFK
jgi:hypothetical protein